MSCNPACKTPINKVRKIRVITAVTASVPSQNQVEPEIWWWLTLAQIYCNRLFLGDGLGPKKTSCIRFVYLILSVSTKPDATNPQQGSHDSPALPRPWEFTRAALPRIDSRAQCSVQAATCRACAAETPKRRPGKASRRGAAPAAAPTWGPGYTTGAAGATPATSHPARILAFQFFDFSAAGSGGRSSCSSPGRDAATAAWPGWRRWGGGIGSGLGKERSRGSRWWRCGGAKPTPGF